MQVVVVAVHHQDQVNHQEAQVAVVQVVTTQSLEDQEQ
jgi:hypothetical protein